MNTQQLLEQVFDTLGISDDKQPHMMKHVDEVLQMTVLERLIQQLPKKEQDTLRQQLEGKQPDEQRKIGEAFLNSHFAQQEIEERYLMPAAQEVVPDYVKALMKAANEEQKQKVNQLLQSLASQPSA